MEHIVTDDHFWDCPEISTKGGNSPGLVKTKHGSLRAWWQRTKTKDTGKFGPQVWTHVCQGGEILSYPISRRI